MRWFAVVVALVVAVIGVRVAAKKWTEESERGAKGDAEARKKDLEIREVQNAAMQEIFAAEKEAMEKTNAREMHSLKISQGAYSDKETLDRLNASADEWQQAIDKALLLKTNAIKAKAASEIERIRQGKDSAEH